MYLSLDLFIYLFKYAHLKEKECVYFYTHDMTWLILLYFHRVNTIHSSVIITLNIDDTRKMKTDVSSCSSLSYAEETKT